MNEKLVGKINSFGSYLNISPIGSYLQSSNQQVESNGANFNFGKNSYLKEHMIGEFLPVSNIPSAISLSGQKEHQSRTDPKGRTRGASKLIGTLGSLTFNIDNYPPIGLSKDNSMHSLSNHNFIPQRQPNN